MKFVSETNATALTMDGVVVVESDDSENSIVEVEVPRKPTPPLIHIEDEEIILNIKQKNQGSVLAKDFINNDQGLLTMAYGAGRVSRTISAPSHWTSDMIKFYDDDWGDEDQFIVENLQKQMDKTPSLWKVSHKDNIRRNKRTKSYVKCWNCGMRGHTDSFCPDPPHIPKCQKCGIEGHIEYSCPDAKCLNCGSLSKKFVTSCFKCRKQVNELCSRCRIIGHNFINCPDHWRLFHLTTKTTKVIVPEKNTYKPDKDMWCCNCGKKGHYQTQCMIGRDLGAFQDTLPFVISYQKAFRDNYSRNEQNYVSWKKNKRNWKKNARMENILQINPMNKAVRKGKMHGKRKFKRLKKW